MTQSAGPALSYSQSSLPLGHSGMTVQRFFGTHAFGALVPFTAGFLFFGWRVVIAIMVVATAAGASAVIWKKVGLRGGQLRFSHVFWLSVALALILPAHLASNFSAESSNTWPILVIAGGLLTIFCWLLGGMGASRIHPVVVTYLVLAVIFGADLVPSRVLQRNRLVVGDLIGSTRSSDSLFAEDDWLRRPIIPGFSALETTVASEYLNAYTTGQVSPDRAWVSLEGLLRDRMPPLQDLILGSHPGPIGTTSAIAVIMGGLFLLYRGLIDYRIPLLILATAFVALLILPIPWRITDHPEWRWAVGHVRGVGWATGVTFANYEILASPMLFMAFFLATSAPVRPLTRRGRVVYSMLIGILSAVFQLYVSVGFGSYLGLLIASLITPAMDKLICPRPLV